MTFTLLQTIREWRRQDDNKDGECSIAGPCCHGACADEAQVIYETQMALVKKWRARLAKRRNGLMLTRIR